MERTHTHQHSVSVFFRKTFNYIVRFEGVNKLSEQIQRCIRDERTHCAKSVSQIANASVRVSITVPCMRNIVSVDKCKFNLNMTFHTSIAILRRRWYDPIKIFDEMISKICCRKMRSLFIIMQGKKNIAKPLENVEHHQV